MVDIFEKAQWHLFIPQWHFQLTLDLQNCRNTSLPFKHPSWRCRAEWIAVHHLFPGAEHTPPLSLKPQLHCLGPLYSLATVSSLFKHWGISAPFWSIFASQTLLAETDPTANQLSHRKKLAEAVMGKMYSLANRSAWGKGRKSLVLQNQRWCPTEILTCTSCNLLGT